MHRQNSGGGDRKREGRDFYEILGVKRDANADELKAAFKKKAMLYHPDRNRGNEDEATEKFKEAKEAFDVLSDPKKRKVFDKYGEDGLKEGGPGGGGGMGDIFSRFFGGEDDEDEDDGRGQDIRLKMGVELKELYTGAVRKVPMQKQFVCSTCQGKGTTKPGAGRTCTQCRGQGMRMEMRQMGPFVTQQPVECRKCMGEGIMIDPGDECKGCNGRRVSQRQHMLEIPIEKGLATGDKVTLRGEANQSPGEEPGDIIVFLVEQTPEDFPFQRHGDDLFFKQKISLTEALVGFKFALTHMDGRTLVISSQAGDVIRPGAKKVVLGEGMPIKNMPSERGRLIVEFEIEFPGTEFVTEEVRKQLEAVLPPVPEFSLPADAVNNFSEHIAHDYVAREDEYTRPEAYHSDEEERGGVQPGCQHQ